MPTILEAAATRAGIPYALPPDGITTLDCSLYVLQALAATGTTLGAGVRTAEQIRQAVPSVDLAAVQPGDFLFFANTYDDDEPPGPDGQLATHIGISLGHGTMKMWDCHERPDGTGVGITDIRTPYWQEHLIGAGRAPAAAAQQPAVASSSVLRVTVPGVRLRAAPSTSARILVDDLGEDTIVTPTGDHAWREVIDTDGHTGWVASDYLEPATTIEQPDESGNPDGAGLSMEPDHQFSFTELWPTIHEAATAQDTDGQVVAAIIKQESDFTNYRVHQDGTGHGLIGLDDHGLLPHFEQWSGLTIGRGASAATIPPGIQIRYLAKIVAQYSSKLGDPYKAARAWHRGEGQWTDHYGDIYEKLIRAHVASLFG